jgi:hypothetical protein
VVARSRSLGGSLSPRGAIRPQIEIGKPGLPEHGAIGSPAGDGDCERLRQTRKTGEGRAPVPAAEPEPGDGGIAAVPADDLPGERVGLGRPGHSQLIASRSNNAERVLTRACGPAPEVGLAWRPVAAWCWLTAHADASDPSHDPHPANLSAGSTRARARPCWSVAPGLVSLDWDAANSLEPAAGLHGPAATGAGAPRSVDRERAHAAGRLALDRRYRRGHERRLPAADVRADSAWGARTRSHVRSGRFAARSNFMHPTGAERCSRA